MPWRAYRLLVVSMRCESNLPSQVQLHLNLRNRRVFEKGPVRNRPALGDADPRGRFRCGFEDDGKCAILVPFPVFPSAQRRRIGEWTVIDCRDERRMCDFIVYCRS